MTQVATDKSRVPRTSKDWDLRAIAPFVALALLLVLGAIANPNFISIDNRAAHSLPLSRSAPLM